MSNHTKGHQHKLNLVCLQCVINKYKQYDELLAFVSHISKTKPLNFKLRIILDARKLLKEIGEE